MAACNCISKSITYLTLGEVVYDLRCFLASLVLELAVLGIYYFSQKYFLGMCAAREITATALKFSPAVVLVQHSIANHAEHVISQGSFVERFR